MINYETCPECGAGEIHRGVEGDIVVFWCDNCDWMEDH